MLQHTKLVPAVTGGFALSGFEVAGTVGGIVGTAIGLVGLVLTFTAGAAKRRREYYKDIHDAEKAGEDRYKDDMEYWRGLALGLMSNHPSTPLPVPPSQRRPSPREDEPV